MHPHTSYLIFATPRSGSYLLCEALIRTGLAGNPTEYFGPVQAKAIMKHLDTSSYKQCLDWILTEGTTPNGVFGGKVIWNFQAEFVDRLRKVVGDEKLSMPEVLSTTFPNLHYIWMTRRDKVRQAISYWKALKTEAWIDFKSGQSSEPMISNQQELPRAVPQESDPLWSPVMQEVTFNYDAIESLRRDLEQNEVEIQQYFASCGIQPFKVVYEDFVDTYEETALQILDYLHIPIPEMLGFGGERTLKKQANSQSEEWLQRYYQLKQLQEEERHVSEIMQESAAQRYIRADVQPPSLREVDWKNKPQPFKLYCNCKQIPLGDRSDNALLPSDRSDSTTNGYFARLLSEQVGQMLADIYGLTRQGHTTPAFHPLLKLLPKGETSGMAFHTDLWRPVPSGGALFPCELYLLVADTDGGRRDSTTNGYLALSLSGPSDEPGHLPAGIYHYDAAHHALDILEQGDYSSLLQNALAHPGDTLPANTLLLSCYFWKDGFNYGAFGYRLQGLDIGTVISQSEIITHHAGLSTTIHYQFQDKALNDLLGLDPLHESVYAVIEWRQGEGEVGLRKADGVGLDDSPTFGTINASAMETNETSSRAMTESIARWPLLEEVHRASLIETREAFRPLHSLAPIQLPRWEEGKTLPLSTAVRPDLWEARTKRHSTRGTFLPTPLTQQQLSQLLLMSMCGMTNDLDGHADFLQHTLLYCIVFRVQGIPAGIYVYQHERHELELVRAGVTPDELYQVITWPNHKQYYMSVCLFPVANYASGFQIYGDRWYRMQNMEGGIIAQRLYLAAAALKLGCRASLGFKVPETNSFLGLPEEYTSLIQIMIAPERSAYQHYEQSLLI